MIRPQLNTFLSVCDMGSFSKAASALFLTPSAVLQQIRQLEDLLGCELFVRSSRGVSLTPAGEYLESRARTLREISDEIRRDIKQMARAENRICIGSSMLEKCRLLYDLWVLFSQEEKDCGIQMLSIDVMHNIPAETDLIESVNSSVPWMREWEFLEICRVPFGFAVVNDHPLAGKSVLTLDDLRGQTVTSINSGTCDVVGNLLDLLHKNHIQVSYYSEPGGGNALWESAFKRDVLLVPMCWSDILINMTCVPFEKEFLLPYGIFYRSHPHPAVRRFLDFIEATYHEGNVHGIVPVL